MFFVCACLSSFVAYLWSVDFVVLTFCSLSVSLLFLLFLSEVFTIINWARFCVWFGIFACACTRQIDVLILCMSVG